MSELTTAQWELLEPFFPSRDLLQGRPGRPRHHARPVLEGILWILRTGAQWKALPAQFPPYQTCHRRFQEWQNIGPMEQILEALAEDLEERGNLDLTETSIDGSSTSAKKGALVSEKPSVVREPKSWVLRTAMVFLSPYAFTVLRHMTSRL